eukprot:6337074-Amphidinium_carterae.1
MDMGTRKYLYRENSQNDSTEKMKEIQQQHGPEVVEQGTKRKSAAASSSSSKLIKTKSTESLERTYKDVKAAGTAIMK